MNWLVTTLCILAGQLFAYWMGVNWGRRVGRGEGEAAAAKRQREAFEAERVVWENDHVELVQERDSVLVRHRINLN